MSSFDKFSADLLEESKRFLELANNSETSVGETAFLHASILTGMSALEAYINSIAEELLTWPKFGLHEKALLGEKDIELKNGEFSLSEKLKIYRLTDRIEFLYYKFKSIKLSGKNEKWWPDLKNSIKLRNSLVHPKEEIKITSERVEVLIQSIIDCLLCLSQIIYGKKFSFKNLGLQSKLSF